MSRSTPAAGPEHRADVLLVTVTEVESRAVLEAFEAHTGHPAGLHSLGDKAWHDLGVVNGSRIGLVLSGMGAGGLGGSLQSVGKAVAALHPSAVVMVGIAFGMNPGKQKIGDILVSEHLRLYDLQRVGTEGGQPRIILRGSRPDAAPRLLDWLRNARLHWSGADVRFGVVLTGDKLVDHVDFRDQLRAFEPEAIGGEMEGAGLYAACQDAKVDWVLVKAICDWADGQKEVDRTARQELAARNAASFVLHALAKVPLQHASSAMASPKAAPAPTGATGSSWGRAKNEFCERLGDDWEKLATELEIPTADQRKIKAGHPASEGRGIWEWLEIRRRLVRLAPACRADTVGRSDLADLLPDDLGSSPGGPPGFPR